MLFVACSGFPVPVSRYWSLFDAVELSDSELGIPGLGTVRRWQRGAKGQTAFSALAPSAFAESEFKKSKENAALAEEFADFAEAVGTEAVVFRAPEEFRPNKTTKAALKAFTAWLPERLPRVVLDLPGWTVAEIESLASKRAKRAIYPAYNPLEDELPTATDFAYARLPGPAGRRSRYDDEALEQIAQHVEARKDEVELFLCVFANIDMQANASALRKRLQLD